MLGIWIEGITRPPLNGVDIYPEKSHAKVVDNLWPIVFFAVHVNLGVGIIHVCRRCLNASD